MPDLSQIVAFVIGLSIFVERVNELVLDFVITQLTNWNVLKVSDPKSKPYVEAKTKVAFISAVVIGIGLSFGLSTSMPNVPLGQYIMLGFLAGALAPYSHTLIELGTKVQKLAESRTPDEPAK